MARTLDVGLLEEALRTAWLAGERRFHVGQFSALGSDTEIVIALTTLEAEGKLELEAEARCREGQHLVLVAPLLDVTEQLFRGSLRCRVCNARNVDVLPSARVTDSWARSFNERERVA